jgi:hypothetical protein
MRALNLLLLLRFAVFGSRNSIACFASQSIVAEATRYAGQVRGAVCLNASRECNQ